MVKIQWKWLTIGPQIYLLIFIRMMGLFYILFIDMSWTQISKNVRYLFKNINNALVLSENSCQWSTKIMGTEMFDLSWYRQYWLLAIAQQWSASLHVFEPLQWITSIRMNVLIHSYQNQSITWWRPKYESREFKL